MKFKVGDKVRVKSYEEIKMLPYHHVDKENGYIHGKCEDTDEFGKVIIAHNSFIDLMFNLCGKEFVVEEVKKSGNYKLKNAGSWHFIACWLERTQYYVETFDEE